MSYGREYLHQLNTTSCLGENYLSKGVIKLMESLIHALMRVYYSGTMLEEKDPSGTTDKQIGLIIALM